MVNYEDCGVGFGVKSVWGAGVWSEGCRSVY